MRVRLTLAGFFGLWLLLYAGCQRPECTLTVSGDENSRGADVFVNGKWLGTLQKADDNPPQLSARVSMGALTVDVKKNGYLPFHEKLTASGNEQSIHLTLTPETAADVHKFEEVDKDEMGEVPRRSLNKTDEKLPVCPD